MQPARRATNQVARDGAAWAEMLATVFDRTQQLKGAVQRAFPPARSGASLIEQLENERGRLARELHAGAGQPLAGIKLHLEALEPFSDRLPPETLPRLRKLADAALGQVRAVSHRLHPPDWQAQPMEEALSALIHESGIELKCRVRILIDPLPEDTPIFVSTVLYRCAQECLSNISRHSGATEVSFSISTRPAWVELRVSDNGQGIPAGAATRGIGLRAIREHAQAAGGVVNMTTGPHGTTIRVGVPVSGEPLNL